MFGYNYCSILLNFIFNGGLAGSTFYGQPPDKLTLFIFKLYLFKNLVAFFGDYVIMTIIRKKIRKGR